MCRPERPGARAGAAISTAGNRQPRPRTGRPATRATWPLLIAPTDMTVAASHESARYGNGPAENARRRGRRSAIPAAPRRSNPGSDRLRAASAVRRRPVTSQLDAPGDPSFGGWLRSRERGPGTLCVNDLVCRTKASRTPHWYSTVTRAVARSEHPTPEELPNFQHNKQHLAELDILPDCRLTCFSVDRDHRRQEYGPRRARRTSGSKGKPFRDAQDGPRSRAASTRKRATR
jgi:hypothetical protein